jgi:hypothetical protein
MMIHTNQKLKEISMYFIITRYENRNQVQQYQTVEAVLKEIISLEHAGAWYVAYGGREIARSAERE